MTLLLITGFAIRRDKQSEKRFFILNSSFKKFFIHPMDPNTWYTQRIDETLRQLSQTKTQINRISLLRVLLFVAQGTPGNPTPVEPK